MTKARPAAPTPLPVIEVQSPCPADWDAMTGDAQQRFCAHCQRHVHDLSAMRSDEVADLICHNAGRLCVRVERAADGAVKTLDYQPTASRWRSTRNWLVVAVLAALGAGGARAAWQREQAKKMVPMGMLIAPMPRPTSPATSGSAAPAPTGSAAAAPAPAPTICP